MVDARQRNEWDHTSTMMALLANIHRDPDKTSAISPQEFNPFLCDKPRERVTDLGVLRKHFVDGEKKNEKLSD